MPEPREGLSSGDSRLGVRRRTTARRAAERHYLAVVAAEARRLARELRPSGPGDRGGRTTFPGYPRPKGAH
jgi:hypothetical protein